MKKLFTVLSLLITLIPGILHSQVNGFQVDVLTTGPSGTTLEYRVTNYDIQDIVINNMSYSLYNIPGMIRLMEKGYPELPSMGNSIIIPDRAATSFRITEQEFTTIETTPVAPSKGHFTRDIDPKSVAYTFSDAYTKNEWYPASNISLDEPYIVRDLRGQTIRFNPMQYNPVTGKLKICTHLVVEVYTDKDKQALNPFIRNKMLTAVSREFSEIYGDLFLNYGMGIYNYVPIPEPGRLLIIYPSLFANKITPFYNWKLEKGIPTLLAEYPAQTGSGSGAIKNYIQNLYNSPEGLTYIILVGESSQIPTLNGLYEGAPSDPCYVKLAGNDAYPDAYISRISPTSESNLAYILWKIIRYEKYPDSGPGSAWYLKGTGVASNEGTPPDWTYADTLRAMLMNNIYFSYVDRIYDPGATVSMVTTALNDGRSVLNYIGHGSGTSWGTTGFSVSSVYALNNGYKNPFIFDVACLNGNFTASECLEEAWLRAGDSVNAKGAIAAYGSSTNASWVPPLDMQYHAMWLLSTRQRQTVGGVCFNGLMKGMDLWGGSSGEGLKMMEQYNIFGDCTTMLTFGLIPDSTAPSQITDLNAVDPTSNSIRLTWTSPLDSSLHGVVSYDLRHSTSPIITNNDFNNAVCNIVPGGPDTAGVSKSFVLGGLNFNTTYYFAIKAKDVWGNTSAISNVTFLSSLSAPQIDVTPDSLFCHLTPGVIDHDTVYISNISSSASTLDYTIELANNVFPDKITIRNFPVADNQKVEYRKEYPDNRKGMSLLGHGGPDLFGYKWIDNNEPGGPSYLWNDIASTGTMVTNWIATSTYSALDEGKAGPFQFGFNFKFYGIQYSQVWFSSNGWLSFTDITDAAMTNGSIPSSTTPNGLIAPLWDDLDGKTTGKVYYQALSDRFIIQYTDWPGYYSGTGPFTFQVVLYRNGRIMVFYKTISGTSNSATVGIENPAGTDGLQVVKNAAYLTNNLALQFSAQPDWLESAITGGRIYNGNTAAVQLNINTDGLEPGNYSIDFVVHSNDPVTPDVTVPVALLVSEVIPVELTGLTARVDGDKVLLNWNTKTETNNRGFIIERKESSEWQQLSFANGRGTTTEPVNYSYTDRITKAGKYTYRISQVDFEGSISEGQSVEVNVKGPDNFSLDQNYPNPFNPATTIHYAVPGQSSIKISVYSMLGEKVVSLIDETKDAGYYNITWNAANLASGVYLLIMEAASTLVNKEYRSIRKMNLLK